MAVRPRLRYGIDAPVDDEGVLKPASGGAATKTPPPASMPDSPPLTAPGERLGSAPLPGTPGPAAPPARTEGGKWNANYEWDGDDRPTMGVGNVGRLEGFNTQAWGTGERGSNSFKNTFGQMASNFDSDQGVDGLMAHEQFKAAFPNATKVPGGKGDLIDFDGPGPEPPVDVIRGAGAEGSAWAWQPGNEGGTPMGGPDVAAPDAGMLPDDLMALLAEGGGDTLAQIQAELDALLNGQGSALDQEALLRELR